MIATPDINLFHQLWCHIREAKSILWHYRDGDYNDSQLREMMEELVLKPIKSALESDRSDKKQFLGKGL